MAKLLAPGGWRTFARRPVAGILFLIFGVFVMVFSMTIVTSSG
ncbi:MAG TPA: hypothetical protein VGR16_13080 [Thermomicrobiales bacterium]|nr:hypothetical protein [Thermomicrobiales bacterium]